MNLKRLRQQKGITQEEMAAKLGVSRPTYTQIEKGEKEMTVSQARTISELFRTDTVVTEDVPKSCCDTNKFKEVLLYILEKVGAKPNIGETALFKLLYFIDFDFYEKFGRSITGATYMRNHHGPTPKQFKPLADEMMANGELERVRSKYFQYDQKKYLPLREANLHSFSAIEKEHIDNVLARLAEKNGTELRAYSHDDVPWMATDDQNDIAYDLVFQRSKPYAQRDSEMEFMDAAALDVLEHLPSLSKKEYDFYMSLPDKK